MSRYKSQAPDESTWTGWMHSFVYVKTANDILVESLQMLKDADRDIDREIRSREREELRHKNTLKEKSRTCKDPAQLKCYASLVENERRTCMSLMKQKLMISKARSKLMDVKIQSHTTQAINNVTFVMQMLNKAMSMPRMMKMQMRFERSKEQFALKEEICAEFFLGDDFQDEEEEVDGMVNRIMDEFSVETEKKLPAIPQAKLGEKEKTEFSKEDLELLKQLEGLLVEKK